MTRHQASQYAEQRAEKVGTIWHVIKIDNDKEDSYLPVSELYLYQTFKKNHKLWRSYYQSVAGHQTMATKEIIEFRKKIPTYDD